MTKFDIHDELGIVMILPPSEGNRELSDEEADEYRENIEKVLAVFPAKDKACDGRQETNYPDRLTRRGAKGGITVMNLPAALEKLAQYEDAAERAEKIMPAEEVIRVLERGGWQDYLPDEEEPDLYMDELFSALDAVLAFMCCDEDSGCIRAGGDPV